MQVMCTWPTSAKEWAGQRKKGLALYGVKSANYPAHLGKAMFKH